MSSIQDRVRARYSNPAREEARRNSRAQSMEFRHTKLVLDPHITPESRVVEFGCATGVYAAHWHDKCAHYLGVDLSQEHVDFFNAKGLSNANAQLGDATACPEFADNSFDVVLCLGPMYHLDKEDRLVAMREMTRICKPGGIAAFAYIPNAGVLMSAITNRWGFKEIPRRKRKHGTLYPNRKGNIALLAGVSDTDNPFFFAMPEEMEALAVQCNLSIVQNAGVDIKLNEKQINHMDEEQYACWLECAEYMLQFPSCTGMANHALLICRKA
ncbi:MAG: class I SAM-dependent methyltransferase [Oscillospiraceae bacterium]|nr:class I SAM-dependent methyltransferase [Oscillospiraceae bacterium]